MTLLRLRARMPARMRLSDLLGDRVAYRNLEPADRSIRGLSQIWSEIGLPEGLIPRKTSPAYAAAIVHFLGQAQEMRGARGPLRRLLFVGDTRMNDGKAAANLSQHLPLQGFIGADRLNEEPRTEIEDFLMISNRWTALEDFAAWAASGGIPADEFTALLIDMDKTMMGARGRNDKVIDAARVEAVRLVIEETLGESFDEVAFRAVYDRLNQPTYHPFTRDNQDYLAYISLMVVGGVCLAAQMWDNLHNGRLSTFEEFVALCHDRRSRMSGGLLEVHQEVAARLAVGDPTPFKRFRYREYISTVSRMDLLPGDASREEVLENEIVITGEVVELAQYMIARGVLTFGISDKPDEASIPTSELADQGYLPLHQVLMKVLTSPTTWLE